MEAVARRRLPRAQREAQLLDVADTVFAERGFRAASMDEIALRAGVTKPILYDHFGSKDGLVAACVRRVGVRLFGAITASVREGGTPEQVLAAGIAGFFHFIESHGQGWFTLIGENAVVGPAAAALEQIRRDQAAFVAQTLAAQLPEETSARIDVVAQAIIGACERVALWRRDHPEVSVATATDGIMALVWSGLATVAQG